ncbi:MAG TPA: glycosyltransferase family 1 protein [Firmicutes bacterium]|nr:glycosyltransferase family 1 protein [Bacillota bacterium]
MKKSLKILEFILMDKLRTGGGIQVFRLAKELRQRGHDVTVLFSENPQFRDDFNVFNGTGVDVKFMKIDKIRLNLKSIKAMLEFRRFLKSENFDIIHCHKGKATTFAYFSLFGLDHNLISNRGVTSPIGFLRSLKYKSKKVKKIIAVSNAVKDVLVGQAGIPSEKVEVVYGSVDADEFKPGLISRLREEFKIGNENKIIGFVGNAGERKGLPYLLSAFKILLNSTNKIVLVLVGIEKEDLEKYHLPPQITSRIVTTGFWKDVPNLMSGFDFFAFSGVSDEGLTGTVREAASCGLPIVTTEVAGNSELIRHRISGLVVPPRDPERLAEALAYLINNTEKGKVFGMKAREYVLRKMTDQSRTKRIERIYYQVIKDSEKIK